MRVMRKILRSTPARIVLLGLASITLVASCQKELDEKEKDKSNLSQRELDIIQLIEGAGRLKEPVKDSTSIIPDTPREEKEHYRYLSGGTQLEKTKKRTTKVSVSFVQNSKDFTLLDPWSGVIWPGALIQGKTVQDENVPTPISIIKKRKKHEITFQVVSGDVGEGGGNKWSMETEMSEGAVLNTQNRLLGQFLSSGTPAKQEFSLERVYSKEDLTAKAGINIKAFRGEFDSRFNGEWNEEKSHILVKLYQVFFTMSCPAFDMGALGCFTDDITAAELKRYTGPGNPICYVSSVSYGRVYYLLYESNVDMKTLELELRASYKGLVSGEGKGDIRQSKVLEKSSITMVQYGGDAKAGIAAALHPTHERLEAFLRDGAKFSIDNVGAPVSYKIKLLADNSIVKMSNTLEYSYNKVEFIKVEDNPTIDLSIDELRISSDLKDDYEIQDGSRVTVNSCRVIYRENGQEVEKKDVPDFENKTLNLHTNDQFFTDFRHVRGFVNEVELQLNLSIRINTQKIILGVPVPWTEKSEEKENIPYTILWSYENGKWKRKKGIGGKHIKLEETHSSHHVELKYTMWKGNELIEDKHMKGK